MKNGYEKNIVYTSSFYIHKKINIQKYHKMKKINKYQTNIFLSRDKRKLPFYLKKEQTRNESRENEFVFNFLFFLNKKQKNAIVINEYKI